MRPIVYLVAALPCVACSASETDPMLWQSNPIGGGNAFARDGGAIDPVPTSVPTSPPVQMDASSPSAPTPLPPGPCALTLDFSTASYGGRYSPRHVQAVWVETAAGDYIQTLEVYGTVRVHNLVAWKQKSGGDKVDAVTGATIPSHRAHSVTWDCIDPAGNVLPHGDYRIVLELTEDNSGSSFGPPSQKLVLPFQKGFLLNTTFEGTPVFLDVHLEVQ